MVRRDQEGRVPQREHQQRGGRQEGGACEEHSGQRRKRARAKSLERAAPKLLHTPVIQAAGDRVCDVPDFLVGSGAERETGEG